MEDRKFYLPDREHHFITSYALEKLLRACDGNATLLYLYILKQNGTIIETAACEALRLSARDFSLAVAALAKIGLIAGKGAHIQKEPAPVHLENESTPQYSAAEVASEISSDSAFASLIKAVEATLGKVLTAPDLNILMSIYRHLGLPLDVIYQLVCHLTMEHRDRYGAGKAPTFRGIEKVAYIWAGDGITTLELALGHIEKRNQQKSQIGQMKQIMHIKQDNLTDSQKKYMYAWIDMGFALEVIGKAYDKTLISTGELKWAYMHGILKNWNEKGLHTPEAIEAQDHSAPKPGTRTRRQKQAEAEKEHGPSQAELARRRKLLEEMEHGSLFSQSE